MGFVFSDVRNQIWDNNSKRDYLSPVRFHESGDWTDPREAAPHPGPSSLSTPALARQLALVADKDWAEVASHAVASAGALAGARVAERVSALDRKMRDTKFNQDRHTMELYLKKMRGFHHQIMAIHPTNHSKDQFFRIVLDNLGP